MYTLNNYNYYSKIHLVQKFCDNTLISKTEKCNW